MGKRIVIGQRPQVNQGMLEADWLHGSSNHRNAVMKRLTIDVPESLHKAIKTACATRGTKIADEVRELLIQRYSNGSVG